MRRYMQAGERIVGTRAIGNGGLEAPAAAVGGSGTEAIEGRGVTCVSFECCRGSMRRMLRGDSQSREGGRGGGSKCGVAEMEGQQAVANCISPAKPDRGCSQPTPSTTSLLLCLLRYLSRQ